ncbi:hypothetical protein AMATHDRAFT_6066 [Amanita thiersii Skay4041]|uniref:Uncharacterized protein n=1 Tax=Amanita thiersii Skay4041 TaxID=703135 RepID=A0A2A9NAW5_9AGAR|nr:hypothetical protein AMATHDRAFT_6066 [Amanita thiersii Skay4041]
MPVTLISPRAPVMTRDTIVPAPSVVAMAMVMVIIPMTVVTISAVLVKLVRRPNGVGCLGFISGGNGNRGGCEKECDDSSKLHSATGKIHQPTFNPLSPLNSCEDATQPTLYAVRVDECKRQQLCDVGFEILETQRRQRRPFYALYALLEEVSTPHRTA